MHVISFFILLCSSICAATDSFKEYFQQGTHFFYQKKFNSALEYYEKAHELNPHNAQTLFNIGIVLKTQKKWELAIEYFNSAIEQKKDYAKAYFYAAESYRHLNNHNKALAFYQQTIKYAPEWFDAYKEAALLYRESSNYKEAITCLNSAYTVLIKKNPSITQLIDLAHHLITLGQTEQTITLYNHILKIDPNNPQILYNKAYTLKIAGKLDEAITLYQRVLELEPDYEHAHFGLAMSYITNGNFDAGWPYYDEYLRRVHNTAERLRNFLRKKTIKGKKILLQYQGGLGDSIQFIRYAQILKEMDATVLVYIQKQLIPLFSNCPYIDQLIPSGSAYPERNAHASLMSLPCIFRSTQQTLPNNVPYLFPDQQLVKYWKKKIKDDTNFKIGICWQVNMHNDSSRYPIARRGIPLEHFYALAKQPGITLYSLQRHDGQKDLDNLPDDVHIISFDDLDTENGAFMDTAALMQHLDVVICPDTAIAHLAGALGIPVYVLLPYQSDWRWLSGKSYSPWYPSMRVFKQEKPFEWKSVFKRVFQRISHIIHDPL
ncbi:tetratricopeptide repeat protein [Candidatus Dependentiae bacterium]|nr:tetratricopeptide repeat protein [Candidatus Dependentiae bacterium]